MERDLPRYFFNISDGVQEIDREGTVLPGLAAARARAVRFSGDAIKRFEEEIWNSPEWEVWVTDESGTTVCSLTVIAKSIPISGSDQGHVFERH